MNLNNTMREIYSFTGEICRDNNSFFSFRLTRLKSGFYLHIYEPANLVVTITSLRVASAEQGKPAGSDHYINNKPSEYQYIQRV
jgi:hypothetical protein